MSILQEETVQNTSVRNWHEIDPPTFEDVNDRLKVLLFYIHHMPTNLAQIEEFGEIYEIYRYNLNLDNHKEAANYRLRLQITKEVYDELTEKAKEDPNNPVPPLRTETETRGQAAQQNYYLYLNPPGGSLVGWDKTEGTEPRYVLHKVSTISSSGNSPFYIDRSAIGNDRRLARPQRIFNLLPTQVLGARIVLFKNQGS